MSAHRIDTSITSEESVEMLDHLTRISLYVIHLCALKFLICSRTARAHTAMQEVNTLAAAYDGN